MSKKSVSLILLLTGLVFSAVNMRSPIVMIGSVTQILQDAFSLGTVHIGYLGALPMPMFALGALISPMLVRRFGLENLLIAMTLLLTVSVASRVWFGAIGLFLGTVLVSFAIGILNALTAPFIKKYAPDSIALATGIFSLSMSLFAGLCAWIVVPLMDVMSWQAALSGWSLFGLLTCSIWLAIRQMYGKVDVNFFAQISTNNDSHLINHSSNPNVWRIPMAWHMAIYLGLQSLMFYTLASFFPSIGMGYGLSLQKATGLTFIFQIMAPPAIFLLTYLIKQGFSTQKFGLIAAILNAAGAAGLAWFPEYLFVWAALMGFGGAATFTLMLMMFSMRTNSFEMARDLSGMAQAVGYGIAFFGPLGLGYLYEISGDWHASLVVLFVLMLINIVFGFFACDSQKIE